MYQLNFSLVFFYFRIFQQINFSLNMITLVSRFSTKLIYFHLSMKSQFSFYQIFPITLLKVYSKDCKKFDICQLMEERDCFRNISVNSSSILLRHFSGIFPGKSSRKFSRDSFRSSSRRVSQKIIGYSPWGYIKNFSWDLLKTIF